jgi:hypothetical protein
MAASGAHAVLPLSDDEKRVDAMILKLKQYSIAQLEEVVVLMGFKLPAPITLNHIPNDIAMRRLLVDHNIVLKNTIFPVSSSKERARSVVHRMRDGQEEAEARAQCSIIGPANLEILDRLTRILQNIPRMSNAARLAANKNYAVQIEADFRAEKTAKFTEYCNKTMQQCQKSAATLEAMMAVVVEVANATSSAAKRLAVQDEDIVPLPDTTSFYARDLWPDAVSRIDKLTSRLKDHMPHVAGLNRYAERPIRRHEEILPVPDIILPVPDIPSDDDDPGAGNDLWMWEGPPLKKKKTTK